MNKKLLISSYIIIISLISCNKEDIFNKNTEDYNSKNILEFSSISALEEFYNKINNEDSSINTSTLGIKSLYSIKEEKLNQNNNEEKINTLGYNISNTSNTFDDTSGDPEEEEDFIMDDSFAKLLNDKGEIIVESEIYKYTDVGLFRVGKDQYNTLISFLNSEGIKNYPEKTDPIILERYTTRYKSEEYSAINNNIQYFHARSLNSRRESDEQETHNDRDGGGYTGPGEGTSTPSQPADPMSTYMEGVNNLVTRKVHKNILGNMFGNDNYVVFYEYKSKRRLKVKYYRQNYGLVYAVGCKVKNQKKGWTGIWRTQSTDILTMGIKTMTYEFPSMNTKFNQNHKPIVLHVNKNVYTIDNNILRQQNSSLYPTLPTFFYNSVNAVAEAIFTEELSHEQIDTIFYKNVWNLLKGVISSGQKMEQQKIAFVVGTPKKVIVQYYDFSTTKYNSSKISRVFDWGIMTPPITYNFSTGFNVNTGATLKTVLNFKNTPPLKLDMYGMVYDENKWKGVSLKIGN